MSEGRIRGNLTKVRLLVPVWLKRAASEIGDLPRRALEGTAYWAGYASTHWHLGWARGRASLPPAPMPTDGDREALGEVGTVACVHFLRVQPWTEALLIQQFVSSYAAQLQALVGFRQAILARDKRNPDLYVAMTLWDSLTQAQSAPELPKGVQDLRIMTSTKVLEIVGQFRPSLAEAVAVA